jgi:adenylate cyclase
MEWVLMAEGIRYSIGLKLSLMVSFILVVSLSLITALVAFLVSQDVRLTAESNNWTINHWSASAAGNTLGAYREKALFLIRGMDLVSQKGTGEDLDALTGRFFRLNPDISCVAFVGSGEGPSGMVLNGRFDPRTDGVSRFRGELSRWLEDRKDDLETTALNKTLLFNTGDSFGFPCLAVFFPLPVEAGFSFSGAGAVFFVPDALEESLAVESGADSSGYIVNAVGEVLFRQSGADEGGDSTAIVRSALAQSGTAMQLTYTNPVGERYYAAFERLPDLEAASVTYISDALIVSRVASAVRRVIIIGAAAFCLSVLFMALYSRTITVPLKALTRGALAIEEGNYTPDLTVKTRDELGVLTGSFIAMGRGIANFERFTNKRVVELARKGLLVRSGEKRTVTVCFTMIRNFKNLTRGMEPQALMDFVNSFLSEIVPCITKTGGLIDKFLTQSGVVVMSVWGAAKAQGNPASDAFNCICGTLMMRNALRRMNLKRISRGEPGMLVKMGCGINTGEAVAGQIGSEERMEYTVIGDTVNLAARIEEPNEVFDTDILVTEHTYKHVARFIKAEEMPSLEVKGKSKPLRVFSVININNYYGPSEMDEVRKLWRI